MSSFLWEDDIPFSDVKVKMEPLDDFDTVDGSFPMSIGDCLFNSPIKSDLKWMDQDSRTSLENTSFDSGYTSSHDIVKSSGLSIDPDFVKENSNHGKSSKSSHNFAMNRFSKLEHGGRFSGLNFHQWSPLKVHSPQKFGTFSLENDFMFEADMSSDSNDALLFKTEPEKPVVKTKRKYRKSGKPRKPYARKQTACKKQLETAQKPSKRLNDARSKLSAALMDADEISMARQKKHTEHAQIIRITKELTARAAQILKVQDPNVRRVRRVVFQENQRLQGDRFAWSVGDSVNKSFKHISVKKGMKRKRGVTSALMRRQALLTGSESD